MKKIYLLIIFFILFLLFWEFINCNNNNITNHKENFENIKVDIGNFLCAYFYNISLHFIEGKDYFQEIPEYDFVKYLPKHVKVDENLRKKLIENHFTKEVLIEEMNNNTILGTWFINNDRIALYWEIMKPFVYKILDNALQQSKLKETAMNETKETICIHFRCSDVPFIRSEHYHLQKYSFFKKCLEDISHLKYKKIKFISCSFHLSNENTKKACDKYITELIQYLKQLDYSVEIQCKSNIEDFACLFYAPVTISTGGSYSFMSGYFGNGIFMAEGHYNEETPEKKCTNCNWLKHGHSLSHSLVKDYMDTDNVISLLKNI